MTRRTTWPVHAMTLVLAGLGVLALLAVVAEVAWLRPQHQRIDELAADRSEAISVAQSFMVQWNSFDAAGLDDYRERVSALMSTKFRTEFETQFGDVARVVESTEMTSSGTVLKTGLASLDDDSAQVLVIADAAVETTSDARQRHFRWAIDLVKVDGSWVVDSWDAVQQPSTEVAP